ncbi:MAG: hypothetical protein JO353_04325 [Phycisphaerae bacterium]|nr:hypothetical protein [Phycisphaerae bacterium]
MTTKPMALTGLTGSNPLAFLSALGVLRVMENASELSWDNALKPILHLHAPITEEELVIQLEASLRKSGEGLRRYPNEHAPAEIVKVDAELFRSFARASTNDPMMASFAAAFASDACRDQSNYSLVSPTRLSLANGNGGKKLLLQFCSMVADAPERTVVSKPGKKIAVSSKATPSLGQLLREAIFDWTARDGSDYYAFRWDPAELRRYAHMALKPEHDRYRPVAGANLLAVIGLTMFPSTPGANGLQTSGLMEFERREVFSWPLWKHPLTAPAARALLMQPGAGENPFAPNWNRSQGVFARFCSERFTDPQKNAYFAPSFEV